MICCECTLGADPAESEIAFATTTHSEQAWAEDETGQHANVRAPQRDSRIKVAMLLAVGAILFISQVLRNIKIGIIAHNSSPLAR